MVVTVQGADAPNRVARNMAGATSMQSANGEILARENFVLAFFARRPFVQMTDAVRVVLEQWLQLIPPQQLTWVIAGKNSAKYRKLSPQLVKRCFEMLDQHIAARTDVFFKLQGPDAVGPDYRVLVKGFAQPQTIAFADETNLVEFLFPMEFPGRVGHDVLVDLAASSFVALQSDSGYAAPALHYGIRGEYEQAKDFIGPRALQHHGWDVPNNVSTTVSMGKQCRGARWLTLLSHELIARAGGMERLRQQVAAGVEVRELSHGAVIRAGLTPELGAINRGETTPLLASVAHAIEPITFFGDPSILPLFGDDEDQRDRWERRFWWNDGIE